MAGVLDLLFGSSGESETSLGTDEEAQQGLVDRLTASLGFPVPEEWKPVIRTLSASVIAPLLKVDDARLASALQLLGIDVRVNPAAPSPTSGGGQPATPPPPAQASGSTWGKYVGWGAVAAGGGILAWALFGGRR